MPQEAPAWLSKARSARGAPAAPAPAEDWLQQARDARAEEHLPSRATRVTGPLMLFPPARAAALQRELPDGRVVGEVMGLTRGMPGEAGVDPWSEPSLEGFEKLAEADPEFRKRYRHVMTLPDESIWGGPDLNWIQRAEIDAVRGEHPKPGDPRWLEGMDTAEEGWQNDARRTLLEQELRAPYEAALLKHQTENPLQSLTEEVGPSLVPFIGAHRAAGAAVAGVERLAGKTLLKGAARSAATMGGASAAMQAAGEGEFSMADAAFDALAGGAAHKVTEKVLGVIGKRLGSKIAQGDIEAASALHGYEQLLAKQAGGLNLATFETAQGLRHWLEAKLTGESRGPDHPWYADLYRIMLVGITGGAMHRMTPEAVRDTIPAEKLEVFEAVEAEMQRPMAPVPKRGMGRPAEGRPLAKLAKAEKAVPKPPPRTQKTADARRITPMRATMETEAAAARAPKIPPKKRQQHRKKAAQAAVEVMAEHGKQAKPPKTKNDAAIRALELAEGHSVKGPKGYRKMGRKAIVDLQRQLGAGKRKVKTVRSSGKQGSFVVELTNGTKIRFDAPGSREELRTLIETMQGSERGAAAVRADPAADRASADQWRERVWTAIEDAPKAVIGQLEKLGPQGRGFAQWIRRHLSIGVDSEFSHELERLERRLRLHLERLDPTLQAFGERQKMLPAKAQKRYSADMWRAIQQLSSLDPKFWNKLAKAHGGGEEFARESMRIVRRIQDELEATGAALVEHGIIPAESWEKYRRRYTHREYESLGEAYRAALMTETGLGASLLQAMSPAPVKRLLMSHARQRKLTQTQAEKLGVREDLNTTFHTMMVQARAVAQLELFKRMKGHEEWTRQDDPKQKPEEVALYHRDMKRLDDGIKKVETAFKAKGIPVLADPYPTRDAVRARRKAELAVMRHEAKMKAKEDGPTEKDNEVLQALLATARIRTELDQTVLMRALPKNDQTLRFNRALRLLKERRDQLRYMGHGWVKVSGRKWGDITRGVDEEGKDVWGTAWVRKDVYMETVSRGFVETGPFLRMFDAFHMLAKKNWTSRNPVTHINNYFGNYWLNDIAGLKLVPEATGVYRYAHSQILRAHGDPAFRGESPDPIFVEYMDSGLFQRTSAHMELGRRAMKDHGPMFKGAREARERGDIGEGTFGFAEATITAIDRGIAKTPGIRLMEKAYPIEDQIHSFALYYALRTGKASAYEKPLPQHVALRIVRRLYDYDMIPTVLKGRLGRKGLMSFVSFNWKLGSTLTHQFMTRPVQLPFTSKRLVPTNKKTGTVAGMIWASKAFAALRAVDAAGWQGWNATHDEDLTYAEWEKHRRAATWTALRGPVHNALSAMGLSFVVGMPFGDGKGNPIFVDFRNTIPMTAMARIFDRTGAKSDTLGWAVGQSMILAPLIQAGRGIDWKGDPAGDNALLWSAVRAAVPGAVATPAGIIWKGTREGKTLNPSYLFGRMVGLKARAGKLDNLNRAQLKEFEEEGRILEGTHKYVDEPFDFEAKQLLHMVDQQRKLYQAEQGILPRNLRKLMESNE